jgi:dTDP-4-dehydrorhamnose reductase
MKIGVIGYKGRIGKALMSYADCVGIDCDISRIDTIESAVDGQKFDAIINCAAYTNVDGAEKEKLLAYSVNSFGPQNISKVYKGRVVHLSTDYIFDGINGPYSEDYFASPISSYGFSKYMGEVGLRPYADRTLIVRTTVIYDAGSRPNFVLSVLKELRKGNLVKAPKYIIGNPTYTYHLAHGIMACLEKELTGIINIAGLQRISRYQLAREIAMFYNHDPNKVLSSVAWGEARRPERAGLDLTKAKELEIPLYTLWQGLSDMKGELERLEDADKISMVNS